MFISACLLYLAFVMGKTTLVKAATENFEVRIYTHRIVSNHSITADKTLGFYVKMYGSVGYTVYSRISAPVGRLQYPLTRFGAFGVDVYKATFTPPIGSPSNIRVALRDEQISVAWYLDKIIVIDSQKFYYEFLFNKWLNATKISNIGDPHLEASLSRKYGGPDTRESIKCMSKGSTVWYRQDSNTMYKPGVLKHLNDSNVTITTVSGHDIVLPRPSEEYPPLMVNDDSFMYIKSNALPGIYIAAFNQSNVYYLGTAAYGMTAGYSTLSYNRRYTYTWTAYRYHFRYKGLSPQMRIKGGILRRIDQKSRAFCNKDMPDQIDPKEISASFSCSNNNGLSGHVISKVSAPNSMVCGMICSRHAQCMSFNFCIACGHQRENCELNKAVVGQLDRKGYNHCLLVDRGIVK